MVIGTGFSGMVAALFDISPLLPALNQGDLILTANNRLRNHILRAYGVYQQNRDQSVWAAPRIYPLNQWLRECWRQLQDLAYGPSQAMIASAAKDRKSTRLNSTHVK